MKTKSRTQECDKTEIILRGEIDKLIQLMTLKERKRLVRNLDGWIAINALVEEISYEAIRGLTRNIRKAKK
jgi:hypothetical protein